MASDKPATDGRQSRWDRHNETRRLAVLDAALAALEEAPEGTEVSVADIAARAGLSRTVLYRHFDDRDDLDRAIQGRIFAEIQAVLAPHVTLAGTPMEIVQRIVGGYVGWAAAHPRLHHFGTQRPLGVPGTASDREIGRLARQIREVISFGATALGLETDEDMQAALDPIVFGFLGMVMAAVHRWLSRPERAPGLEAFSLILSESIWRQIEGMAAARGLVVDPDVPVEDLLASALRAG